MLISSVGNTDMSPRTPTLVDVMSRMLDEHSASVGVCTPGIVESFNRTTQTARVRVVTLKTDGSSRPVIPNAPVVFPGAYWDVQSGEGGLLIMADEDWRTWWRTDEDSRPESVASHELANSFFIPGVRSRPNARTLPVGSTILPGDDLRLGEHGATEPVLRGDALDTAFATWLTATKVWIAVVASAIKALGGNIDTPTTTFDTACTALDTQITLAKSSKVKVAD